MKSNVGRICSEIMSAACMASGATPTKCRLRIAAAMSRIFQVTRQTARDIPLAGRTLRLLFDYHSEILGLNKSAH